MHPNNHTQKKISSLQILIYSHRKRKERPDIMKRFLFLFFSHSIEWVLNAKYLKWYLKIKKSINEIVEGIIRMKIFTNLRTLGRDYDETVSTKADRKFVIIKLINSDMP